MRRCCRCGIEKSLAEFHKKGAGYVSRCKPCAVLTAQEWYFANKSRRRDYDEKRRVEKRQLYRDAAKRFRQNNPGAKNADTQARRARLRKALPAWANLFFIAEIYDLAARRTRETGFRWEVDHIIPLKGKTVCGLHVENNLRVIPWIENTKKHNRFDEAILEHHPVRQEAA